MSWRHGKHSSADYGEHLDVECDVAILGAGAGGCAAASALAERGFRVALFEEGKHWNPGDFKASNAFAFRHVYAERGNRVAVGNGWMPINGGRGVGGSTLINSAISFRTPDALLDGWRERYDFDPELNFSAYLDEVMATLRVGVDPMKVQGRNNTIFAEGMEKLGWTGGAFMPRSAPGCVGCGVCQLGCPSGGKWSADRSFLAKALLAGEVGVYADCRASGVTTEGSTITAINGEIMDPHSQEPTGTWSVKAKHVILSGGSFGSPRFLMKNGLSESEHLGHHLRLHPATGVFAKMPEIIEHWRGVSQGYWVDRWEEGFLMETAPLTPDANFLAMPLELGEELNRVMADLPMLALAGVLVHDEDTEARVTADGVFFEFGDGDRKTLLRGLTAVAEVFFAAGAEYLVLPIAGASLVRDMDQVRAELHEGVPFHRIMSTSSHPMGTCRIGADPDSSVLDVHGRVWGWDNLNVADASTFPEALGVNPQVTVMAMGLHVGHTVADGLSG
jgi:choline dehydrogenase-like flavoprotein